MAEKKFRVVIIEDNLEIAKLVNMILESTWPEKIEMIHCSSWEALLHQTKPDLVILDNQFPWNESDMAGSNGLRAYQALQKFKIPVVAIPGHPEETLREKGQMYGDLVVYKPFRARDLIAAVRQLLSLEDSEESAS